MTQAFFILPLSIGCIVLLQVKRSCLLTLMVLLLVLGYYAPAQTRRLVQYLHVNGLPSNTIYQSLQDREGFIWFATDAGLSRFDGHSFTNFTVKDGLPDNEVLGLDWSRGNLRIFTFNHKVAIYDFSTHRIVSERQEPSLRNDSLVVHASLSGYFKHKFPFSVNRVVPIDAKLYFATDRGVYIYNADTTLDDSLLSGQSIYGIMRDRDGNVWISTAENGAYCLLKANGIVIDKTTGLSSSNVQSLFVDRNGTVYAGSEKGTIDVVKKYKVLRSILLSRKENLYSRIRSFVPLGGDTVAAVTDGGIWVGFQKELRDLALNPPLVPYNKAIAETHDKKQYLIGSSAVLDRYDIRRKLTFRIADKRTTALYVDRAGSCWFGSIDGLYKVNPDAGIVSLFAKNDSVLTNTVSFISGGSDGIVWVASHSYGLTAILPGGQIQHFTERDGLISDIISKLYVDTNRNNVWIATFQGLCKLHYRNDGRSISADIKNYTLNTGLVDNKVNDVFVKDDTVYAATSKGLCIFRDDYVRRDIPVYFTKISVDKSELPFASSYELGYKQDHISVSFSGICYSCGGNLSYAYRLLTSGGDTNWKTTLENTIEFAGLSPGKYTFQVRTNQGPISTMAFTILAPFWERPWFYLLVFLTCATILTLLYRYRINTIKKREAERTAAFKQISDLELRLLQAQLNPHFIFNALNAIQMYINLMDKRRANEYLVKLARLMRLFLDASREPFGTIQNEILILSLYCELEKLRFEDKFEYDIRCDDTISRETLMFPSMLVQPFVENAINHGLMNKGRNALLVISFVKEADMIICTIDDNGIGRKKAMELRQKSGRHNRSWGVGLSEERVQALNKLNGNNTSIEIIDKTDSDGNAAGTRVVITVSLHTNKLTNELQSHNY